jgi:hypothetical protein
LSCYKPYGFHVFGRKLDENDLLRDGARRLKALDLLTRRGLDDARDRYLCHQSVDHSAEESADNVSRD